MDGQVSKARVDEKLRDRANLYAEETVKELERVCLFDSHARAHVLRITAIAFVVGYAGGMEYAACCMDENELQALAHGTRRGRR
jgi:hypothetical protein